MKECYTLLNKEIVRILKEMEGCSPESEKYKEMSERLKTLYDAFNEQGRVVNDGLKNVNEGLKILEEQKSRKAGLIKTGLIIGATIAVEFIAIYSEETRVFTSKAGLVAAKVLKLA